MATHSKASKLFLWTVLVGLVMGLAGFGVSNFGGGVVPVASVGQTKIDVSTYGRALQQQLRATEQQGGKRMTFAEAQAAGLDQQVLQNLLGTAALDEATRLSGLSVGDDAVREQILQIKAFQGLDGKFDRTAYGQMLTQNGMTVGQFESSIRTDLARNLLQSALVSGVAPAPVFADTIYTYVGERRSFTHAALKAEALTAPVPAPTDAEVETFYMAHPALFTLPERKEITYAWLTPAMLIDTVEIDEAALKQAYQDRIGEFVVPERRMVDRLAFADEAAATAAKAAIDAGTTSFDALVAERNLTAEDVDLGEVGQDDLDTAGPAVFALADTGVVGPLPTLIGPALFRVNAILDAHETTFEQAIPTLREDLAGDRARRVIEAEVESLDDQLAGGATLEELAQETDLELGHLEWSGTSDEGLAGYDTFRLTATALTKDDFPVITALEDGAIYAMRLDDVIAPALQPLDAVRDQARALAWVDATAAALKAKAAELQADLDKGSSFEDLGLVPVTETAITRRSALTDLPPGTLEQVFAMQAGTTALVSDTGEVDLLRLDAILPPDPEDPTAGYLRQTLGQQAGQSMAEDVLTEIARAFQKEAGITINQSAINGVNSQIQ